MQNRMISSLSRPYRCAEWLSYNKAKLSVKTVAFRFRRYALRSRRHADPFGVGRLPLQATESSFYKVRI